MFSLRRASVAHLEISGLKRLDTGALVKDYEGPDKETEQAVQMVVTEVASEDPRYMEKEPPPLSEEFPVDSKVFFLGEHAYGVAAQVSATTNDTLSVVLAVSVFTFRINISLNSHAVLSSSLPKRPKMTHSRA